MHPNEELARREAETLASGDMDALEQLYADDFVLHYPGRNPLSGDHHGFGALLEKIRPLMGEDGSVTRELHDAFGSDDHATQLMRITANAKGKTHTWEAAVVMHTRDGKITEAWALVRDVHALDEFLNSLA